jgi:hypothetical protein
MPWEEAGSRMEARRVVTRCEGASSRCVPDRVVLGSRVGMDGAELTGLEQSNGLGLYRVALNSRAVGKDAELGWVVGEVWAGRGRSVAAPR